MKMKAGSRWRGRFHAALIERLVSALPLSVQMETKALKVKRKSWQSCVGCRF
jgi:hypothetical protein